jgi:hypothetical protein
MCGVVNSYMEGLNRCTEWPTATWKDQTDVGSGQQLHGRTKYYTWIDDWPSAKCNKTGTWNVQQAATCNDKIYSWIGQQLLGMTKQMSAIGTRN